MAIITSGFNCTICTNDFTDAGDHSPVLFQCGHGCCKDCKDKMIASAVASSQQGTPCHLCKAPITMSIPNHELVNQMQLAAQQMIKLVATPQSIKQLDAQLKILRSELLQTTVKNLAGDPANYSTSFQKVVPELIEAGIYKDPTEAEQDLSARVGSTLVTGAYKTFDVTEESKLGTVIRIVAKEMSKYDGTDAEQIEAGLKNGYIENCNSRQRPVPQVLLSE